MDCDREIQGKDRQKSRQDLQINVPSVLHEPQKLVVKRCKEHVLWRGAHPHAECYIDRM